MDPSSRAWLEFLRRESTAFEGRGRVVQTGKLNSVWSLPRSGRSREASAVVCRLLARGAIRERLSQPKLSGEAAGVTSGTNQSVKMTHAGRQSPEHPGGKKPIPRNRLSELIDRAPVLIAESKPSTQEEVFDALQSSKMPFPPGRAIHVR